MDYRSRGNLPRAGGLAALALVAMWACGDDDASTDAGDAGDAGRDAGS